jgi:hypothetical protein
MHALMSEQCQLPAASTTGVCKVLLKGRLATTKTAIPSLCVSRVALHRSVMIISSQLQWRSLRTGSGCQLVAISDSLSAADRTANNHDTLALNNTSGRHCNKLLLICQKHNAHNGQTQLHGSSADTASLSIRHAAAAPLLLRPSLRAVEAAAVKLAWYWQHEIRTNTLYNFLPAYMLPTP